MVLTEISYFIPSDPSALSLQPSLLLLIIRFSDEGIVTVFFDNADGTRIDAALLKSVKNSDSENIWSIRSY